jgi:hypothetical protein
VKCSGVEVRNKWIYISVPLLRFHEAVWRHLVCMFDLFVCFTELVVDWCRVSFTNGTLLFDCKNRRRRPVRCYFYVVVFRSYGCVVRTVNTLIVNAFCYGTGTHMRGAQSRMLLGEL